MRYNNDSYEDELDRMRARRQRKKNGNARKKTDLFEMEELDNDADDCAEEYETEEYADDDLDIDGLPERIVRTSVAQSTAPMHNTIPSSQKRIRARKKKKKRRFLKLLFLIAVLIAGYLTFQWVRDDNYWTIAVFGVDSRDGNLGKGALSDVEMLCSMNKKTGEIRLVSVFRDSYLRIDQSDDYDKINEAYFKGGHKQATDALRDNLDLQIDDYAVFNWKAVVDAINVLGGVDLDITDKEFAYINSFITETVESTGVGSHHLEHSGMNHLDGVQAVAYARLRLMDTDFNRTERQRKVLGQVMEKAKQADAGILKTLVAAVYPQVSTSVGVDDLLGMAKNARKYYIGQTSGFPFSHQETKIGKKSCVIPTTLESNVIQLHGFLYDHSDYTPSATVRNISNHIAEASGFGIPGDDIESGKNVGAEGSSVGGQHAAQNSSDSSSDKPQQAEQAAPAETESVPEESEIENSTEAESESESAEETIITPSESAADGAIEGSANNDSKPVDESAGSHFETPAGSPPGGSAGPGTSAPDKPAETPGAVPAEPAEPAETKAALVAPGQNDGSSSESQGPGAVQ